MVLDLGGGSLQLTAVAERRAQRSGSWPLGAVRVTEQHLPASRAPSRKQLKHARAAIREQLARRGLARRSGGRARRHGRRGAQPRRRGAGRRARRRHPGLRARARAACSELVAELATLPGRRSAPCRASRPARADIVLGAARRARARCSSSAASTASRSRAPGCARASSSAGACCAEAAPLLADVRVASIRNLALQFDADIRHADHVARLALQLHDSLVAEGVLAPGAGRARAAVGGGAAARRRDDDRLRRPPRARPLPDPQGRAARLRPARGRADRARSSATTARARPSDAAASRAARCCCASPSSSTAGRTSRCIEARLVAERRALRLRLRGDDRLALWSLERRLSDGAFRRVFGRRLVVKRERAPQLGPQLAVGERGRARAGAS